MLGSSKQKVPGGKMLEARVEFEASILRIEILGDFFLHPEEAITDIEDCLVGMPIAASAAEMALKLRELSGTRGIEMIGITPEAIAWAVSKAVNG